MVVSLRRIGACLLTTNGAARIRHPRAPYDRRMDRRTLFRVAAAGAGAPGGGGAGAWYALGAGARPAVPGAVSDGRRWRVTLPDQPDALLVAGDTVLALGTALTAYGAGDGR